MEKLADGGPQTRHESRANCRRTERGGAKNSCARSCHTRTHETTSAAHTGKAAHRVVSGFGRTYFGGAGVNTSGLRPGSGFGLGFGAFLTSFLPLSLFPMAASLPQFSGQ